MATAKNTKQPQDHKPSKQEVAEQSQVAFADVEGSHLLVPFDKVKGSDQLRLMGRLTELGVDDAADEDGDFNIKDLNFEAVADFIDYVGEKFAVNADEFEQFTMGNDGAERALGLAMAYAGELGNAEA